ncbi:DUF4236 domain-containing protein [Desulfosporosinus sp. SB140]|uniref:DUF4236 domain-containing protein n=1 Tax=Desulfosporosinus paludis TaxID=3115649 RepID=UPI0038904825
MGFRMRKSIKLGVGFRINLSKSGIGYSWGVPGYRITKTAKGTTRHTYSLPGTGLSYVDESKQRTHTSNNISGPYNEPPVRADVLQDINSAPIDQFKSTEFAHITKTIEKTLTMNRWSNILLWCTLLAFVQPFFLIVTVIGIVLKIMANKSGVVELEYTFDDEKVDEYNRKIGAWTILNESQQMWQIVQQAAVSNTKVNAGASRNINRINIRILKKSPFYIATNVEMLQIKLKKELLLLLPDKIFIIRGTKVGAINYSEVKINTSQIRFVERGTVAKDAQIIDHTWQYVNKNGTADKRFKNNRQLPVCLYGVVHLSSSAGLNVELQCSNLQKVQGLMLT